MRLLAATLALVGVLPASLSVHAMGELIGGDITFKGTVVAHGCSIVPTSENIAVDFKTISTKTLYAVGKSTPVAFSIELQDCSTEVFNTVTVTFSGTPNPNMNDRIAITAVGPNSASGIGIGLEEADGTAIQLNQPTSVVAISGATMKLDFKAFVEGEPDALSNNTLSTGAFTATANYTLNYQ
ncbi:fimbrial protein [Entomohabitans teleogrylli]|uniref:fimbrial protein n=1 Tax=Entomohabitans teleogrylli TaxID=1384589 RepID=UPI00073D573B|nr:fimbrial protein [Entomohabitans teleogrylli]